MEDESTESKGHSKNTDEKTQNNGISLPDPNDENVKHRDKPAAVKQEDNDGVRNGEPVNGISNLDSSYRADEHRSAYSLCVKCQKLKLNFNCFIVRARAPREITKPADFQLTSTTSPISFGTLGEILKSGKHCSLCNLIVRSITQERGDVSAGASKATQDILSATCTLSWEVDGREVVVTKNDPDNPQAKQQSPRGLTRRIHLRWNKNTLKDSYLVYVASGKRMTASDAERAWNPGLLFLGREIGLRGNIQARVKSWIDLCQDKHQGPCAAPQNYDMEDRFFDMISHSYFGVIDVLNMQLTELPKDKIDRRLGGAPQYVALSYVWGKDTPAYTPYKTKLENVMQHRMHGGLDRVFHQLPKVIQDAIDLVRRLGFQYLWIDSLCIIQDSSRSWKLNAYNMDLIYGNAAFTICAADGPTAFTGLLAMHEGTGTGSKDQLIADCTDDVRLVVSRPPEMYIKSSKWNTRAWTFQERLLSRRCLIFTGSRVYFQCRSTGMSEDIYADREGAGWSLDFMDAPLQTFRQLPLRSIWVYMKTVKLYTARDLTNQADILAAFSGVSNLMQQTMQAPFVFGLPTSHFDLALLWEYLQPVHRRRLDGKAAEGGFSDFPSWSWSGWYGASAHYRRDTIEECLDDVNEWLEDRTWIRWHIRDGNGDLRPLWDQDDWRIDRSEHEKWQGYGNDRSSGSMTFWTKSRGRRSTVITRSTIWPPRDYDREERRYSARASPPPSPPRVVPPPIPVRTASDVEASTNSKGTTRIPKGLVKTRAIVDLGYPYKEEDGFIIIPHPLEKDKIDQLLAISEHYEKDWDYNPQTRDSIVVEEVHSDRVNGYGEHYRDANTSLDKRSPDPLLMHNPDKTNRQVHVDVKTSTPSEDPQTFPASAPESAPFVDLFGGRWKSTSVRVSHWAQAAYRNEIVRFFVVVLMAILRLSSVLLGMPVRNPTAEFDAGSLPNRKHKTQSARSSRQKNNILHFRHVPPHDLQRSRAPSPSAPPLQSSRSRVAFPDPPPQARADMYERRESPPPVASRQPSYDDHDRVVVIEDDRSGRWNRTRFEAERRLAPPSPPRSYDEVVVRRPRETWRISSPVREEYDIRRDAPRSALYSEIDRAPRSSRSVKQVRYLDEDRRGTELSTRSIDPKYHDRSSRTDDRRFHDLVFQPDRKMEPEQTELRPEFRITLKEYPYQPVIAPYDPDLGAYKVSLVPILQFWTWHTFLHIQCPLSQPEGLIRCNIADKFGDWCGSIMLDARWVGNTKTAKQEFIAISEAKKFTDEECGTWSYYVPKEREESEWDLFYVLLIAWNDGRWERVGLGKAFKEAFRDAVWKEIVLA